jgi:hypothetical protein
MSHLIGGWVRKLSVVAVVVGVLVAFFTEAFADVKIGRDGRPKPPIARQRLHYLLMIGGGLPGAVWAFARSSRREPSDWD